jgi:hypothetical protein
MNKKLENVQEEVFDNEYAIWLQRTFPKSISNKLVHAWRYRGFIPRQFYYVSPVLIHGVPLNTLLLFEGHSQKDIANEIGVKMSNFTHYLYNGDMPTKYLHILEEKYIDYKNRKNLVPKLQIVHSKHYFVEHHEDLIHLKAVHSAQTKNKGKMFFSKTILVNGEVSSGVLDGKEYLSFIKESGVMEVSFKKLKSMLRTANKLLKNINL